MINHSQELHPCSHFIIHPPIHHTRVSEQGQPQKWKKPFQTDLEINLHACPASDTVQFLARNQTA